MKKSFYEWYDTHNNWKCTKRQAFDKKAWAHCHLHRRITLCAKCANGEAYYIIYTIITEYGNYCSLDIYVNEHTQDIRAFLDALPKSSTYEEATR